MIKVNEVTIPESAILAEMQYHPAESKRQAMLKAAETLVIGEILRQRAQALGVTAEADSSLASQDDFLEKLLTQEVTMPRASEEECELYFRNNPQRFLTSPLVEARHILLPAPENDEAKRAEVKNIAESVLAMLKAGESFKLLAQRYSACPSKETGGSLGQLSAGQTVPEFERQVFRAGAGLMPAPVESRYGYHVVEVIRHIDGQPLPYNQVRERIRDYLNEKVRMKSTAQYIQTLIQEARIEGFDFSVSDSPLMQ